MLVFETASKLFDVCVASKYVPYGTTIYAGNWLTKLNPDGSCPSCA